MKPVRADFAPPRVPGRWHWLALAALVITAMAASGFVFHQRKALTEQRAMLDRQAAERRAAAQVAPQPAAPPPYERSAREMLAEHRLAWPEVLTELEATALEGVTPVSVEISAGDGTARVEVSFSDHAKLLDYLEALNAGRVNVRWVLVQAQAQTGGSTAVLQAGAVRP